MSNGTDIHWTELVEQCRRDLFDSADDFPAELAGEIHEGREREMTLAACETFYGHGFADDQLGDVEDFGHFYRVSRWTVRTDNSGRSTLTDHGSEQEAREWWATLETEYAEWSADCDGSGVKISGIVGKGYVSCAGCDKCNDSEWEN